MSGVFFAVRLGWGEAACAERGAEGAAGALRAARVLPVRWAAGSTCSSLPRPFPCRLCGERFGTRRLFHSVFIVPGTKGPRCNYSLFKHK